MKKLIIIILGMASLCVFNNQIRAGGCGVTVDQAKQYWNRALMTHICGTMFKEKNTSIHSACADLCQQIKKGPGQLPTKMAAFKCAQTMRTTIPKTTLSAFSNYCYNWCTGEGGCFTCSDDSVRHTCTGICCGLGLSDQVWHCEIINGNGAHICDDMN